MFGIPFEGRPSPPAARCRVLRPRSRCSSTRAASADFCSFDTKLSTSSNTWFRMSWGTEQEDAHHRGGSVLRHQPQPRTKPHPPMEDLHPTAGPAPSVAPPLGIWPRLTHHVPLSLQTGQVPAARAQVRGGRVNVTGGLRQAGSPRRFRLGDGLRLGSPAASGRLYRADRCADRRAALQGRGLVGGRRATLQLLLRGPVNGEGQTEAGSPQGPREGKNSGLKTETLIQKGGI